MLNSKSFPFKDYVSKILDLFCISVCDSGWLDLGEDHGCFYFAEEAGAMNWFEAQDYCNDLYENAYLAEIKSAQTQELLVQHADSIPDHNWWLGGADFFRVKSF